MRTHTAKMNGNPSRCVLNGNKANKRGNPVKQFKKTVTPSRIVKKERRPVFESKEQMVILNKDPMSKLETVKKVNPCEEYRYSLPDLPSNSNLAVQGFIRTHVKHAVLVNELKKRNKDENDKISLGIIIDDLAPRTSTESQRGIVYCSVMSEVNQSLVLAAKEGLVDLVRELLTRPGINVDYNEYKDLNSALHWAAKNNNIEVAKLLIAANANVNLRNKNKKTPLHHVAEWNRPEIAELLVRCPQIDLNVVNKFLQTPLHEAAVKNHFEVVETLLTAGANFKLVNNNKNTPLHLASFYGHTASVQLLLKAGAGVKVVNELKQTPLHNAGNIEIARMIIEAGAEIDAQDVDQETVLHYEARKGHADMLEMLLNAGADSYLVNKDGYAAFDLAEGFEARDTIKIAAFKKAEADRVRHTLDVSELADASVEETFQDNPPLESIYEPLPVIPEGLANNCELVQLCKAGEDLERIKVLLTLPDVDVNFQLENKSRNTALHWAAKCGKLEVVKILLANKANMHIRNKSKKTALHYAAEYNGLEIAVLLIAAGADVNALNRWRQTPLHEAASRGYHTMVSLLLSENANTKLQNNNKNTALHLAAGIGYVDIVKSLLSAGAYVNIVNDSNETPLHHAKTVEILQLLVDAGADLDVQDKNNDTALHHETKRGNLEGVRVLLAAGCDVFLINHDGYSPYHLTDNPEIKQIIKDAGNSKLKVQRVIQPLPSGKHDEEPKPLTMEELQAENAKLRQKLKTVQGESDINLATANQALKDLKLATSQLQHISRTYDKVFGNLQLVPEDRTLLHARLDAFLNQGGMTDFSLEGLVTFNERASMDIALGEGESTRKSIASGGNRCIIS